LSAIKKKRGRVLYIDMDMVTIPKFDFIQSNKKKTGKELKKLDPFMNSNNGRKFKTPQQLQKKINEYFDSCYGPGYYKGNPILDVDGNPVIVQKEPFTISGLARYLHVSTVTLYNYDTDSRAGLIPPEYAEIIRDAKLRIQEYAEKRLYDRDGSGGAKFVLEAGFGWMTDRDRMELKQNKKRIKVAQAKLKLLQDAAAANKLDDNQLIVNIMRAGEGNDD
jgi:hypothetical protein